MRTSQPQPPAAPASPEFRVQVGTDGVKLTQSGADATAALTQQAQLLKSRIQALTKDIESVKAEMSAPGAGPLIGSNQVRLTALEGRRIDAEEALQRVENQIAGIGVGPALTTEVGAPTVLFEPNPKAGRDITTIWVAAIVCIGMPIAIEMERMSEGQRYVTKLLAEREPVAAPPALRDG